MKHLEGKTAFVTGAASGIGLGIATALAQAGVKVMLCDIEKDALDKAVASLRETNADVDGVVALSEDLRPKLAARGIGVSVLCPGVIRTNIVDSGRNIPSRFAGQIQTAPVEGPGTEVLKAVTEAIASGIDPLYVGELVREAIEGDWPHIFTDLQFEPYIDARFAAIKEGFDRIRDRTPRH